MSAITMIENDVVEASASTQHQVQRSQSALSSAQTTTTPADILRIAMDQGADLDRLERLMELQERWEANEARKAYVVAMSEFKRNPPEIFKDKQVTYGQTSYMHATLGNIVSLVVCALAEHGFSHRWVPKQQDGRISVTCILTHKLGYSEETTLEASPDSSGGKNSIQAVASAVSYLERYTILSACGLATKDMDDDGNAIEAARVAWIAEEADKLRSASVTGDRLKAVWLEVKERCRSRCDMEAAEELLVIYKRYGNEIADRLAAQQG